MRRPSSVLRRLRPVTGELRDPRRRVVVRVAGFGDSTALQPWLQVSASLRVNRPGLVGLGMQIQGADSGLSCVSVVGFALQPSWRSTSLQLQTRLITACHHSCFMSNLTQTHVFAQPRKCWSSLLVMCTPHTPPIGERPTHTHTPFFSVNWSMDSFQCCLICTFLTRKQHLNIPHVFH